MQGLGYHNKRGESDLDRQTLLGRKPADDRN